MSRYESYLVEVVRLCLLVFFIVVALYFLKFLPFISDLSFIKTEFSLYEFIEFIFFALISFLLGEFSFRVERTVDSMLDFVPKAGRIHRYIMLTVSFVFLYWGGVNAFSKLISSDFVWLYQMFFAGVVLFIISKIFLIIYYEGENFGRNILSKIKELL